MLYMLDTDISSYIIRGGYGPVEKHLEQVSLASVCISVMTRAELLLGLKQLPPSHRLHIAVHRFLRVINMLSWQREAADFHAEIKYQLKLDGTPIGEMDMLITAHAMAADAVLVTNNTRHFSRIKMPLMMTNWME